MWHHLMHLDLSVWEKVARTVAVYLVLAVLVRLAGKRDLAQLNAFDLVVVLLLSNVVQNAVIGPDNSLLGGAIGAAVLVAVNAGVVRAARRSDGVARLLEGTPTTLARDGQWDPAALRREGLRQADVEAALRRQNANSVNDVEAVSIEPGDAIVTIRFERHKQFRRDGKDLRVDVPITLYEAVLGAKVRVPTLDGSAELTLPPGVDTGKSLRLKGKGLFGGGDLYATLRIELPKGGDPDLESLMRFWRDQKPYKVRD